MEEKSIFAKIFSPIKWTLGLINNYFKSFLFLLILFLIFGNIGDKNSLYKPNLVKIDIHGAIMNNEAMLEQIMKASENDDIKGVLLHINSPGGALAPSVELAYEIKKLKEKKPVVAYAAGTMASGSYYAGIWSDTIIANPGAFIGSIGVIFQGFNVEKLANSLGIKAQVIKAGKYKEAGTFLREWSEDEKKSLSGLIDKSYQLFVTDVAKARKLNIQNKEVFADAKVFLAKDAREVKLIDKVGTLSEAIEELKLISGVMEARWQKKDRIERLLEKFASESAKSFINIFYDFKTY